MLNDILCFDDNKPWCDDQVTRLLWVPGSWEHSQALAVNIISHLIPTRNVDWNKHNNASVLSTQLVELVFIYYRINGSTMFLFSYWFIIDWVLYLTIIDGTLKETTNKKVLTVVSVLLPLLGSWHDSIPNSATLNTCSWGNLWGNQLITNLGYIENHFRLRLWSQSRTAINYYWVVANSWPQPLGI